MEKKAIQLDHGFFDALISMIPRDRNRRRMSWTPTVLPGFWIRLHPGSSTSPPLNSRKLSHFFQRKNPPVTIRYLNVLLGCIDVGNGGLAVVIPEPEAPANAAATAFLHILVQLHEAGSDELRQRYRSRLLDDIASVGPTPMTIAVLPFCL